MSSGAALFDYDLDGDLDLYLGQGGPLGAGAGGVEPGDGDRLYRNDPGDGGSTGWQLVDVSSRSGALGQGYSMGVAVGDPNDDGALDLYVSAFGANSFLKNRGDGTFEDITIESGTGDRRWTVPATFFDADGDGDEDLFAGNYAAFRIAAHEPCRNAHGAPDYCHPSAYDSEPNRLFLHRSNLRFDDRSEASGIGIAPFSSLGAVARDFDGDGRDDLYVANDQQPNRLWISAEDGTFRDEAALLGVAVNRDGQPEASMGIAVGDPDGDGDSDLFVSHLRGESNTLYRNEGGGLFTDATVEAGLSAPSRRFTGFGTGFLDFDRDGQADLFVGNGAVQVLGELAAAGDPFPLHQTNQLFRNVGGRFLEVSGFAGPPGQGSGVTRAVAIGDIDNDGRSDIVVHENNGPARLYLGQGGGGSIGFRVVHRGSESAWIGSRVLVEAGGLSVWGESRRDGSYAAASDPRVLIGVGAAVTATVTLWVGERRIIWRDAPVGRYSVWSLGPK